MCTPQVQFVPIPKRNPQFLNIDNEILREMFHFIFNTYQIVIFVC